MAATIPKQALEQVAMLGGMCPTKRPFKEAAGQSFALGELVYLVDGLVTVCEANPANILGMAMQAASGTTSAEVFVTVATGNTLFRGNLSASQVTAQNLVGNGYGITATSSKWHVDTTKSGSAARVVIDRLDPIDTVADVAGRVYFLVLSKFRQLDSTS